MTTTFVATRELTESMPDGELARHPAGTPLERFTGWDYAVQRALLRMGYVRQVTNAELGAQSTAAPPTAPPTSEAGLTCALCPDRTFVNHQGLRLHVTRMHAPEAN